MRRSSLHTQFQYTGELRVQVDNKTTPKAESFGGKLRCNRVPMTMHVAICAEGGTIALVGDTKVRTTERVTSDREPLSTVVHRSKIVFTARHDIAVAMA